MPIPFCTDKYGERDRSFEEYVVKWAYEEGEATALEKADKISGKERANGGKEVTDTGIHFRQVPDVWIIYITQFDLFGRGKTMYHAQKVIQETGDVIKDGLREIYLNTEVDDGSLQAALMQNFMKEEMADQRFPEVSRRFHDLKHDEKEVVPMCKELEQYLAEGHAEGEAEGKAFVARNLFRAGMSIEEIAKMVGMTAEVVRQWLDLKKTEL